MSSSGILSELKNLAISESIKILSFLGLASLALFAVLGRFSSPLGQLEKSIHAIEQDNLLAPIPFLDRRDEVGALANALNDLREREVELTELRIANSQKVIREGARIQHALHSTRDIVILTDETNTVVFRNVTAKTFLPLFSVGDALIRQNGEVQPDFEPVRSALSNRSEIDTEFSVIRHGAVRHFRARTGPVFDKNGFVLGGLLVASDITEQLKLSKEAHYFASHDPLTGLQNRRQMEITLNNWTKDSSQILGMLLMDLDHFKNINDSMGHIVGDAVLVEFARVVSEIVSSDVLAIRLGGDEFAIVARGPTSEEVLDRMAAEVIEELKNPFLIEGQSIELSISAGIAALKSTNEVESLGELMHRADQALYQVKNGGRGHYKNYTD
jgi:diguanylate cyclase (GGDEF)-like protein